MKCELVEKTSKTGKKYVCIEISLTPTYKKLVFIDPAEEELLRVYANANK